MGTPQSQAQGAAVAVPGTFSRARVACRACNARRVRCNASQGRPCSNCASAKEECQLIESKRGKYERIKRKASSHWNPYNSNRNAQENHVDKEGAGARSARGVSGEPRDGVEGDHSEGSEMLYARLADIEADSPQSPSSPLDSTARTVYLGETFNLAYIVDEAIFADRRRMQSESDSIDRKMHWTIPLTLDNKPHNLPGITNRLEPEEIDFLNFRGALSKPAEKISDALIRTYFEHFHPAFPIYDRRRFAAHYKKNKLSMLTLQAVYFVSSTLCDEKILLEAGFQNRFVARQAFYNRAKALYDVGYETRKLDVLRALLLMSFYWNGPTDEKDAWHWLGAAIGLAQSQGLHRSTAKSNLSIQDQRLWKRIWWVLYIRDRHNAVYLGLPMRIRDSDCDVEMLCESDFEYIANPSEPLNKEIFLEKKRVHVAYVIQAALLAVTCGRIVSIRFSTKKSDSNPGERESLSDDLQRWKQDLPDELSYRGRGADGSLPGWSFWVNMLHLTYNDHMILLHRPTQQNRYNEADEKRAFAAANVITSIVDDLLVGEMLRPAQLYLTPSIFSALTMHIASIQRSSNQIQRQVSENHARLCMLALSYLQWSWPVCSWILQLFRSLLTKHVSTGSIEDESNIRVAKKPAPQVANLTTETESRDNARGIMKPSQPQVTMPDPVASSRGMLDSSRPMDTTGMTEQPFARGFDYAQPFPQGQVNLTYDNEHSNNHNNNNNNNSTRDMAGFVPSYQSDMCDPGSGTYDPDFFSQVPHHFPGIGFEFETVDQEIGSFLNQFL